MKCLKSTAHLLPLAAAFILSVFAGEAHAYVGPGPGLTVLGALWAVIAAVVLAVLAIIRWPLKALMKKMKNRDSSQQTTEDNSTEKTGKSDGN